MMAPKWECVRALEAAFNHLSEIAGLLDEPINKIEFVDRELRFSDGQSFVPVFITYYREPDSSGRTDYLGGGDYRARIGEKQHL